jgi:rare lipoprotein A
MLACLGLPIMVALTGCHHKTQVAYQPPPPPERTYRRQPNYAERRSETEPRWHAPAANPPAGMLAPDELHGRPSLVETGMASWYGTQYNHRHAADGTVYDQDGMTAAHRTLPLGTLVRVTNLTTGQQVVVRITDRGPFVRGRVLDLSEGAAKAVGVYRMGVAQVRIEAFPSATVAAAGQWCVQTGAFVTERDAIKLKQALLDRYRTARVLEFQGPTGFWVRIDPATHDRMQASAIQDWIGKPDDHADAFLVRIN